MAFIQKLEVPATTDGAGAATVYSDPFTGRIVTIRYVKTDFDNGVDFVVTVDGTGEAVWTGTDVNASATVAPRQATHGVDGAASLYAAGGEPVEDKIAVAHDRLKFVIAAGGATKTGTFLVIVE